MQIKESKSIIIAAAILGAIAFLLFGDRSLADVFYFIGGIVGIAAFLKLRELRDEVAKMKERTSERVEEIEYRIDELEKSKT